jgi:hypothetical protein
MKLNDIKEKKELISVALSGISVLFAVLTIMKIISYFGLSARAQDIEHIFQTIKARDNTKRDELDKYLRPTKELANSLKKSNLFAPPQEKKNPITEVRCILDNEAFINGSWYKQGGMVQDARIVTIEPAQVSIEWDGKTTVYRPMDASMASAGAGERPPSGSPSSPSSGSSSRPGITSTAGPGSPSGGTAVPPPQERPSSGSESMLSVGSGTIPNIQSLQGQPPEQTEQQLKLKEALEKARSMSSSRTDGN